MAAREAEPGGDVYRVELDVPLKPSEKVPKGEEPQGRPVHLPSFTFRTMDHASVDVLVNGEKLSSTPCLWSITDALEYDPGIPVPEWPPAGAKFTGSTRRISGNAAGVAEVWIADGEAVRSQTPHVRKGEYVLYVKGQAGSRTLQGALRLYVGTPTRPYRYTDYNPVMNMESEEASRLARTLWFEPPADRD